MKTEIQVSKVSEKIVKKESCFLSIYSSPFVTCAIKYYYCQSDNLHSTKESGPLCKSLAVFVNKLIGNIDNQLLGGSCYGVCLNIYNLRCADSKLLKPFTIPECIFPYFVKALGKGNLFKLRALSEAACSQILIPFSFLYFLNICIVLECVILH